MIPFRRILFPVDYSENCRAVVPYIKDMVRHAHPDQGPAELILVHAYGPEALAFSELAMADPDLIPETEAIQEQQLHDFASELFPDQPVVRLTRSGEPGTVIHETVQHQSVDLVMLPTHGRGPVRRFLLGSVTSKVLHDVGAAVWTGAGSAFHGHAPAVPYKSILCALDGSPEAECVLRAAAAMADLYKAGLSLIRVIEPVPATEFDMQPYQQERIETAHFEVRELQGNLGTEFRCNIVEAPVADGVRREALRLQADLIITGRGHAQGVFTTLRSHLYQIIRESPCPVLSV